MVVNIQNLLSNNNAIELNGSDPHKYTAPDADSTMMDAYTSSFGGGGVSYNDSAIYETDNMASNHLNTMSSNATNSDLNGSSRLTNIANGNLNFNHSTQHSAQHSTQMTNGADHLQQQQVYYEQPSANDKLNEPVYTDYQYGTTDSGQVNGQTTCQYATNDQVMAGNQLYSSDFGEQMPQQSSSSTPSVNSSSNYSSNSPSNLSAHSTQLLDLNAYSAGSKAIMDYQSTGKPNYGANKPASNRINQIMSSSNQSRSMDRPQSTKGNHQLKQPHYSKGDRKLLRPHSTPATLTWLEENYEIAEGVCIPRSSLYEHYVDWAASNRIQPVNAASFGKIIRQRFPQLTTR